MDYRAELANFISKTSFFLLLKLQKIVKNDQLYLTYTGNQLKNVLDGYASRNQYNIKEYQDKAQNGSNTSVEEMSYDANGNMIKDLDRDIVTIKYNLLNLPDLIQFKNGCQIKNTYSANGQKLSSLYVTVAEGVYQPLNPGQIIENLDVNENDNVTVDGTDYVGNIEYQVDRYFDWDLTYEPVEQKYLYRVHNPEGYVSTLGFGSLYGPVYNYYRKDHLGNNREVWNASYKWGSATRPAATNQITQYYPSGLPWKSNTGDNPGAQPYKYGGKEFVEMHGYDSYDFQARILYPAIGPQFMSRDPLCEKKPWLSPYVYCSGNPINRIDPDGKYDIENINKNQQYKVVAVFQSNYMDVDKKHGNNALATDVAAAQKASMPIMFVDNLKDYADAMKGLKDMGSGAESYTLNSHGNNGFFYIGESVITKKTDFSPLKVGLSDKTVFIGACHAGSGTEGASLIEKFSGQTSSTVIGSDHYLNAGYKYDGSGGLTYIGALNSVAGVFGGNFTNNYHLSTNGSTASQIYNVTINKNSGINWNSGNQSLYQQLYQGVLNSYIRIENGVAGMLYNIISGR